MAPKSKFRRKTDLKLLRLVKEKPVIYNPSHSEYCDIEQRELVWKSIGEALQMPALEFAGIQCQIQFGDYNEDKHKSGFIENLNEYLPIQYAGTWGIEKKILKGYSTHAGLNEIEAKHLYTKTARELPTYGVTFFLVKEKMKGKKKLVPRLLGINSECILRLDETTKEVLQSWPLTHLKTYYAGKGETFTLNFGDYNDKEYSVKTRDAFRIRDILEGYIDLIRKRMLAQYHVSQSDHGYVGHDNVSSGTASVMQHISNNPSKLVEHSFVGPSKIEQFQPGQRASHGTQMLTAQQMLISEMKNKQEQGVLKAEVSMRSDMGVPFSRRLNRLNSHSVKIVNLLSEPSQTHLEDTRKIVDEMNADMPCIRDGVRDTISKQSNEEERKKLQDQLNQLDELMKTLSQYTEPANTNPSEAEDAAKQIATLCTEMYFAIAPEQRRRSRIISKTRQSFIADERTERNLRRASFIAASATTNHALDSALELAKEEYKGPALSPKQIEELERSTLDKLAKINAAIAHYTLAHSDPTNIDYSTAVNSLNTIHELMPDLAREAQMLASAKDGKDRSELLADVQQLCAAAKHLCSLSGVEDSEKLQEASSKYADVAGRLVYVFGKRGGKARADKENEILELAETVVEKTSTLLNSAKSLGRLSAAEPGAKELNDAGAATASAAKQLMAQAVLNAPTIHEAHCQSALTASSEALSSSAQQLAAAWKPLVEHPSRHVMGEKLHNQTMDLAKALDKLREAYGSLGDAQDGSAKGRSKQEDEAQRLQFINSLTKIGGNWKTEELDKPLTASVKQSESAEAQNRLSDRVAQLNAAIAALLAATTDRENPDYATAEAAIDTINKLMPEVLKDSKTASANQNAESRVALLANIKELCAASKNVCASAYGAEPEALNDAIMQYTDSSGRLTYVINKRANPDRESQVIDVTSAACAQAGVLLSGVQQLAEAVGGAAGEELDARGARVADAARALFTAAQVTSPSISDPRCQATLLDAVERVASSTTTLEQSWKPLLQDDKHEMRVRAINGARKQLDAHLDKIRALCQPSDEDVQNAQQTHMEWTPQKLQFITTLQGTTDKLAEAHKELNKPAMPAKGSNIEVIEQRLNQGLEQLNAAMAALLCATADPEHPDYVNAQQAADTITLLMPQLIRDTKTVSASKEECARAAMLAEVKALCEASEGICASAYGTDIQSKNDAVAKFADASGKLVFVANPRRKPQKKNEVVELAKSCSNTSALLPAVQSLAEDVGGTKGKDLNAQGKQLATAVQGLLQAAQILGPSLQSQECQEALLSSIANLTTANKQLAASLATLQDDPKHGPKARQTLQELKYMLSDLEALKAACRSPGAQESQEQKLHFVQTLEASKPKWAEIQKELKKPVPPSRGADVEAVQERLTSRLAALDAALAALLTATSDPDQPSYAEAEKSVKAITELLPHIIHDTKTVSASKEECARAAMLAEVKALCEASEGICASSYGSDIQSKSDAVAKFANASEKLVFVANPRRKSQKKNEVVELARAACNDVSAVLPTVQSLSDSVGGTKGKDLDAQGCRLAMAAQNLLQASQILSPSLQSQQCQEALLTSSSNLSTANQQLAALLAPLQDDAKHGPKAREALRALEKMKLKLEALNTACKTPGKQETEDQHKLHFIQSMEASKPKWADIQKELKKPVAPSRGADVEAVQERLSSRLAALDAALAALLSATSDPNQPSYAIAEKSVKTITELLPQIIHDTKTVSACKEEGARAAMLDEVKALCEASEGICASAYDTDSKSKNDAVAKFAEASEKLVFVANPRRRPQKQNEVVELTRGVCSDTSAVLPTVQTLADSVGGYKGKELDAHGTSLAIAAQNLLQAAQILSPSLQSQQCQEALLSSIANVSTANQQLASSVASLKDDHKHGAKARETMQALQAMNSKLQALAGACKASGTQESQEQQKLHFVQTLEASKPKWAEIQKELKKPVPPSRETDVVAVQERLSSRLASLDAALAVLLAATSDPDQPEYAEAEKSIKTVTDLLPQIIQDTRTVSASKKECARAAMLAEVKALCEASEGICASAYGTDTKGMNEEVAKFSEASSKLVYVANPRLYRQKERDVLDQAHSTCANAAALLSGVQLLAESAGGRGRALDVEGGRLADATQNMLRSAQITSATLSAPDCHSTMVGSIDRMSETAESLSRSLTALGTDAKHSSQARELTAQLSQLQKQLEQLKKTCQMPVSEHKEQEKRQFVKTLEATKGKWGDIQKDLIKPLPPSRGVDVSETEKRLCSRLAALDAALAALLAATADQDNPSYVEAEKSVKTVSELLPHIIQDTKIVSASKEEGGRAAMLAEVKALCEASEGICASSYGTDTKSMNEAVAKFTEASGKLVSKANPQLNRQKEKEVLSQAQTACGSAAALLSAVQRLAESAGGRGQELDAEGGRLADHTQNMLRTAQITSTALSTPECRSAMVGSVDRMSETADSLSRSLSALSADAAHGTKARELTAKLSQLQAQLDRLKKTCMMPESAPPVNKKPYVVAHAGPYKGPHSKPTQEFLDRLRAEETWGHVPSSPSQVSPAVVCKVPKAKPPPPPARKTDDDKLHSAAFVKSLEDAQSNIKAHESSLMKQCRTPASGPALSHKVMMQKQEQLQRHLALAGVEVANLVAANYADKIDYTAASKSTKVLPQLMNSIVEDGTQLADNLNDMARKAFLYDMLQLCEAGRKICDHANNDRQKMNDSAIHFGDTSTKLLYVVSNDVDPALEKEIISRAKAIGDSASRLALDAANVATAPSAVAGDAVQDICDAGTACVDAAGKLVYTAKLTAPSIHEVPCQDALVASTETLSKKLKTFSDSWAPLESDPQQAKTIAHLSKETVNLERILAGLRSDVKGGNIGRRKELEQLVVEDTPIRQLAVKIIDEAKHHAESTTLDAKEKIAYAAYVDKANDALRALDLANARCKKTPHDTEKRRELERSIQNLQAILLQSRPSRGDKGKTNIVDLMDFMEEVAAEAKNVFNAASSSNVPTAQDKLALEEIKDKCDAIETKANKLIRGEVDSDLDFNDLFDQFGQECDVAIKELRSDVRKMEDAKTKKLLDSKIMALSESCNMLRFATKSGISTEACCTLDGSLDELDDIEARVIKSIVQDATAPGVTLRAKKTPPTGHSQATINLCREVTSSPSGVAPSTVTAYIADAASRTDTSNPEENNKLLKHLYKLVHLLKTLTVTSSKRAATWQTVDSPETAKITEQILKEIYNPESGFGSKPEDTKQKILDEDIVKLLIPSAPKILGDNRQQEDRLTQAASQLSSSCGLLSRDTSAATLGRTARVVADKARELDGIARGVHITDPVQKRRIDGAAKEMSFATYNVLNTAESVCLEPKNSNLKRRLADALQNLNHSIDKLVWHSSSSPVLKRQCDALTRSTAAQLAALQPRPHTAAPFNDTCELMIKQSEQICKLKSDKPMPRKEFMQNLDDIGTAVRTSVECASQCAYYIAISEHHKDIAKSGLVEVPVIQNAIESIQDSCMAIIGSSQIDQAKEQKDDLHKRVSDFATAMDAAQLLVKDADVKRTLVRARSCISDAADDLQHGLNNQQDMDKITPKAVNLLEAVNTAHGLIEKCPLVPTVGEMSNETKTKCDEVINHSKTLLSNTLALLDDVHSAPEEPEMMTWVTFNTNRKKLLDAYDALLKTVRRNGHRVGIYEKAPEEEEKEKPKKSYIEIQVDLANKWLKSSVCKTEVKVIGQQAVRNVVDMARQMSEDLKGPEREEVRSVITETEDLLSECSKKYDHEKNSVLMDRVKELRKSIQRGVVTRVVEDFIEAEAPLADLDLLADIEPDETKRKFILERKIASLLAQLGRVTKTARFVANASKEQSINVELTQCSEQTELLAPMLVKAAQQRIDHPDDKTVIENYKALLAQYAESISKVRDLCDRSVDPMDFVQTAGDTMQRMREDMGQHNGDPQKCVHTSTAITKLANRVINVSMSSNAVASDPELQKALIEAKIRLNAVTPASTRASRMPDWRDTTAEILRTTEDVESALGGENIFKKEPTTANQPIYSVARSLHESVREWSSRDNEIVGVARRMAVLMARLSEYMETDKTNALIVTSKSIVLEAQEVSELAKKLAHECTDVRIKTNLLQTCERIPTISGQLKMLTAVKAASLGQQGMEEDKEAMDMLVGNAQSLMMSVSDVVKAAASASVKIMSQRGPRLRWVRKNYY